MYNSNHVISLIYLSNIQDHVRLNNFDSKLRIFLPKKDYDQILSRTYIYLSSKKIESSIHRFHE